MEGNSSGIHAQSIGGGGGSGGGAQSYSLGAAIGMSQSYGGTAGAGGNGGSVTIENENSITTHGVFSHGIFAESIGGGGGNGGESFSFSLAVGIPEVPLAVNSTISIGGDGGGGGAGGVVQITNSGAISTDGFRSYGIFGQSVGGGGGDGGSSESIDLSINCNVTANQVIGGNGGGAGDGSTVNVSSSGSVTTRGDNATGILAQSVGGGGGGGGDATTTKVDLNFPMSKGELIPSPTFSISQTLGGSGGNAGDGKDVTVDSSGSISTSGSFAHGILAQSVGGGGGTGGDARTFDITLTINPADFIPFVNLISYASTLTLGGTAGGGGQGGNVNVSSSGAITTQGPSAYGILAQSVGGGGGAAGSAVEWEFSTTDLTSVNNIPILGTIANLTNIKTTLDGGAGAAGDGQTVTVNNSGTITTQGAFSYGIFAQSVGGGGGLVSMYNPYGVTSTIFGANAEGILTQAEGIGATFAGSLGGAGSGGNVYVNNSGSITTTGQGAHGIFAQSAGGGVGGDVSVTTSGDIFAQGPDSCGILAQSKGGGGNGNLSVTILSGTVEGGSGQGAGVYLEDGANNTLTNHGTITTVNDVGGTAILANGGNETINNYGTVIGSVNLGEGSHTFNNYSGATFNPGTTVDIGSGNTLLNAGTLSPGGTGNLMTTTLTGNLVQTSTGVLQMQIDASGNHDELLINGGSSNLNGTLSVAKTQGLYSDGTVYKMLETTGGGTISGSFSTVVLPEARPLLSFTADQKPTVVEVDVHAPKFSTIATNQTALGITRYLDTISSPASGNLANVLGEFQSLSTPQLSAALATLNPATYDNDTRASYQSVWQYIGSLQRRMSTVRAYDTVGQDIESKPLLLAYLGSDRIDALFPTGELSQTQTKSGLWFNGFGQWGDQGGKPGFAGFDYNVNGGTVGFDHTFNGNTTAGVSLGYSRTDVDQHGGFASGDVESFTRFGVRQLL